MCLSFSVYSHYVHAQEQNTYMPFTADYQLAWHKGIKLTAHATRKLSVEDNHYTFSLEANNFFASLTETSHFDLGKHKSKTLIMPDMYQYTSKVLGKEKNHQIDFEWSQAQAYINSSTTEDVVVSLPKGTLDILSLQLQLKQDLKQAWQNDTQSLPLQYKVITNSGVLVNYHFAIEAMEYLNTPAGKIDSIKLVRTETDENASDSAFYLWYAPELDFLMTGIEQIHADGEKLTMRLKKLH